MHIAADSLEKLYHQLKSSGGGLKNRAALQRLKNIRRQQKKESRVLHESKLLLRQFKSPLVLLLLVAVVLSGVMGEITDMLIILVILLSTGLLSFFQERNAGRAVEKMQQLLAVKTLVLRDGKQLTINSGDVVPGDILILNAGDIIPADCRVIQCQELHVNQSSLTGESFAVEKGPGEMPENTALHEKYNCLWKGTHVVSGTASALAVFTGQDTLFGKLRRSLESEEESAFEKGIRNFGSLLLRITLVLSLIILIANIFFDKPLKDSILFSLAIAVGMAPELLPAIITLSMTAGAKRMMKKKVIVKKLNAIINFGEVTVLCTDKTGTLTEGISRVKKIIDADENERKELYVFAKANAFFQQGLDNPLDKALAAMDADISGYEKCAEIPYDFLRKRLTVLVMKDKRRLMITKGAVENVLQVCNRFQSGEKVMPMSTEVLENIRTRFRKEGEDGYRVLALAWRETGQEKINREDETGMVFMGFILLDDPLKEGVMDSVKKFRELNTQLKIITGDNRFVAASVARQIGLDSDRVLVGPELAALSAEALQVKVKQVQVFAEIEPQQKENIIRALQKSGEVVAYMGDGINDVAAIHAADAGISVNHAADVAREAADLVLLEKDLSVLADGIVEGRKTFANSIKYIFISTGATFGNMFSVAGASLLLPFLPMLPKQILLTNFISDFPYLAISNDNVDASQQEKPSRWDFRSIKLFMLIFGLHSSVFDFITFYFLFYYSRLGETAFQTGWFLESGVTELLILFIIRSRVPVFRSKPSKLLIILAVLMGLLTFALIWPPPGPLLSLVPLNRQTMTGISVILLGYLVTGDLLKKYFFRYVDRRKA